jgi:hypothetical protein
MASSSHNHLIISKETDTSKNITVSSRKECKISNYYGTTICNCFRSKSYVPLKGNKKNSFKQNHILMECIFMLTEKQMISKARSPLCNI